MADDGGDYEAMPSSSGPMTHMMAGAAAGILEHVVMYPVDIVKVGGRHTRTLGHGCSDGDL